MKKVVYTRKIYGTIDDLTEDERQLVIERRRENISMNFWDHEGQWPQEDTVEFLSDLGFHRVSIEELNTYGTCRISVDGVDEDTFFDKQGFPEHLETIKTRIDKGLIVCGVDRGRIFLDSGIACLDDHWDEEDNKEFLESVEEEHDITEMELILLRLEDGSKEGFYSKLEELEDYINSFVDDAEQTCAKDTEDHYDHITSDEAILEMIREDGEEFLLETTILAETREESDLVELSKPKNNHSQLQLTEVQQ